MTNFRRFIREETILFILIVLFIALTAGVPGHIHEYHKFIDWKTIVTLLALITVSTGLKESGYLNRFASHVLTRIKNERSLALFLTGLSAGLSMVLTNDITLFIVVPITAAIGKMIKNDIDKLVIFEAIAVNAGSTLTAIGNPQNIFLWHKWGIQFFSFSAKMFLTVAMLLLVLWLFVIIVFRPVCLHFGENTVGTAVHKKPGVISLGLMILFLLALQFEMGYLMLPVIIAVYFFYDRKVLKDVDWLLIVTFILMFIDFALMSRAKPVQELIFAVDLSNPLYTYLLSLGLSQIMSNVPASIFISGFSHNWQVIAIGVNIAGNGIIIGSLANIIALRLLKSKDKLIWLKFHKYSLPYFIITAISGYAVILLTR
ncbi:MAG: citrate transporter [Spirochaetia bacterium]|nr:citrate transporter [Spirochaetia bacterium]